MPLPSDAGQVTVFNISGVTLIDALLHGIKWGGLNEAVVTYSFPWTNGDSYFYGRNKSSDYTSENEPTAGTHYALSTEQQNATKAALQSWANVADLQFIQVADNSSSAGTIRVGWTSIADTTSTGGKAWGWAYRPSSVSPSGGDIWLSGNGNKANTNWNAGSFNYSALIHEIGHALGLKHTFEGDVRMPSTYDTAQYSIMSYTEQSNDLFRTITYDTSGKPIFIFKSIVPETPMVLDIAAMQYVYGVNKTYRTGNDVYTFDPNTPFLKAIWDAGGNDTISVANFTLGCMIDLTPGAYSDIRMVSAPNPPGYTGGTVPTYDGRGNLGIAYGAYIENAIGGAGSDTLYGNKLNNSFTGNGGNDAIDGDLGLDTAIYNGLHTNYSVSVKSGSAVVAARSGTEGTDTLINVERLHFTDENIALDINGIAGQAYRLYQAAFDRKPDLKGLGYWINDMDQGSSLTTVAAGFMLSPEFQKLYGSKPTNTVLVTNFYQNVLHRTPDQAGFNYWLDQLNTNKITAAGALASFCESAENQALVIGSIQNGIEYLVWPA
ncbi:DUF4214 domain-containing protein [Undibacterium sp.]|uniref:DUF4214 domain-containing protein n=1 Tax=Undibacterium sp. TaxID=1914977 RepID=UPI00272FE191|nr:DUF4214 domain-containing protein [Undibacterium sp.]MDP1978471.1 DUF4214 domain-containing protein [Undibacterium sp.]